MHRNSSIWNFEVIAVQSLTLQQFHGKFFYLFLAYRFLIVAGGGGVNFNGRRKVPVWWKKISIITRTVLLTKTHYFQKKGLQKSLFDKQL